MKYTEEDYKRISNVISIPKNQIKVILSLMNEEKCAGDIASEAEISQPHASSVLKKLKEKGFVAKDRRGCMIYYKICDEKLKYIMQIALQ